AERRVEPQRIGLDLRDTENGRCRGDEEKVEAGEDAGGVAAGAGELPSRLERRPGSDRRCALQDAANRGDERVRVLRQQASGGDEPLGTERAAVDPLAGLAEPGEV